MEKLAESIKQSAWKDLKGKERASGKKIYTFHLVVILILCNFISLGPIKDRNMKYALPEDSFSCLLNMSCFK